MGLFDDIVSGITGGKSSSKRIRKIEFRKALKGIPQLTGKERTYVEGVFGNDLRDGIINIAELHKELSELKSNKTDPISDQDVKRIKEKLSGIMIDKLDR